MGFKLAELLIEPPVIPLDRCVTGKTVYRTKADGQAAAIRINRHALDPMRPFRCGWCERYHLGHRGQSHR